MKIAVGSENPIKIKAVKKAFVKVWPEGKWTVYGFAVKSGVSRQPMSDEECIKGARNRAGAALEKKEADFGVGIEAGLQKIGKDYFDCGWVVILHKNGKFGMASSARIWTPPKMMKHIFKGMELGDADDLIFQQKNSKQQIGHFGLLTNSNLTRLSIYTDAIISALAFFIHPEIYK